jgi:hypothetical protein
MAFNCYDELQEISPVYVEVLVNAVARSSVSARVCPSELEKVGEDSRCG